MSQGTFTSVLSPRCICRRSSRSAAPCRSNMGCPWAASCSPAGSRPHTPPAGRIGRSARRRCAWIRRGAPTPDRPGAGARTGRGGCGPGVLPAGTAWQPPSASRKKSKRPAKCSRGRGRARPPADRRLPTRAQVALVVGPSQHRADLLHRPGRWLPLLRHALRGGRVARPPAGPARPPGRGRDAGRSGAVPGRPGRGPPGRAGASGREARQRAAGGGERTRPGGRLRPGQGNQRAERPHGRGRRHGHGGLHAAGAGAGPGSGRPLRPVLRRRHGLPHDQRPAAVRGENAHGDAVPARLRDAQAAGRGGAGRAPGVGGAGGQVDGQGPRRTLPELRGGACGRPALAGGRTSPAAVADHPGAGFRSAAQQPSRLQPLGKGNCWRSVAPCPRQRP